MNKVKEFLLECLEVKGRWNRFKYLFYPILFGSITGILLGISYVISLLAENIFENITIIEITLYIISFILGILGIVFSFLAIFVYYFSHIKRLHDLNKSGWFSLLLFIPLINLGLVIYCIFYKGTSGKNKYGHNTLRKKYK